MATHSSILAWKIPWTEKSGMLQSMGLEHTPDVFSLTETFYTFHIIHHLLLFLFSH